MEETKQKTEQAEQDGIKHVLGKLEGIANRFFGDLKKTTLDAVDGIKDIDFKKAADDITSGVKATSKDFLGDFENAVNNIFTDIFTSPDFTDRIKSKVKKVKDFPKSGVDFIDISPLIADPDAFTIACLAMVRGINMSKINYIVGIESRGFLFASKIAEMYDKGVVLVRKRGKLPPPIMSQSYTTEYSTDVIEMHPGIGTVLVVDDVFATGGTLNASIKLCRAAGYQVEAVSVFIDLTHLHPEGIVDVPVVSALQMDGKS